MNDPLRPEPSVDLDQLEEKFVLMRQALLEAIASYPGGMEAVAMKLDKTATRLAQEIDSLVTKPTYKSAPKLGVEDAVEICKITGKVGLLEVMAGPGHKLVKLPPPSVTTNEPAILLRAGLLRFGTLCMLWSAVDRPAVLAGLAEVISQVGTYAKSVLHLHEKTAISSNENKALGRAYMDVILAMQKMNTGAEEALLSQVVADFGASRQLLEQRVPERP